MHAHQEDRWLSVEEIADYLGVRPDTVYKWLARAKIPGHKVGRLWKFKSKDVDVWVRAGGSATATHRKDSTHSKPKRMKRS